LAPFGPFKVALAHNLNQPGAVGYASTDAKILAAPLSLGY
jgi:hypothetical protein